MNNFYILHVDSPDQPGLVAAVANCLHDQNYNIEDAAQFHDKFSGRFFMRTVFSSMDENDRDAGRFMAAFSDIATHYKMDWRVHAKKEKVRAVIMVSKADHCLNDILYRTRTNHLPLEITAVVSNHEDCREIVEQRGLRFEHLPINKDTKAAQEEKLSALIHETEAELIVLARYMQVLTPETCAQYTGRIINIHHSFLPGFKGARPYHQAWERGVKVIGATAHFVTSDLDEGPIIAQKTVPIDHAMTPDQLQTLGRDTEAQVLAKALQDYSERRIFLHNARTVIL